MSGSISVEGLRVCYGATRVLDGLDLAVEPGEFLALLGPSGCGKTTLLRAIAGFVPVASGRILADGRDLTGVPAEKRGTAMVFQSYALWPHMTVAQNIGYGLRLRGVDGAGLAVRVEEILTLLGLAGLGERRPAQLSGGQRQRVALGRALAVRPALLLLDEPLSSLDARIREELRHEIRRLQQRLGITTVHVTHDREEAMVMADRIAVLDAGRVAQLGTPEELFHRPTSAFVARFMGATNEIRRPAAAGAEALLFRPDGARLLGPGEPAPEGEVLVAGRVTQVAYLGNFWRHGVEVEGAMLTVDHPARTDVDAPVELALAPGRFFAFPAREASAAPS